MLVILIRYKCMIKRLISYYNIFVNLGSIKLLFLHISKCGAWEDVRDWSLITGRGATKWENCRSETFCVPPKDRVKLSALPPPPFFLKGGKFLVQNEIQKLGCGLY